MGCSQFDNIRWSSPREHSWAYAKFNNYETELMRMDMAYTSFRDYGFQCLGKSGYNWDDTANKLFTTHLDQKITFNHWKNIYNHGFESWYSLNRIVALCSNFENYLASIVQLSIESDPSLLLGHTKLVDGLKIIEHNPSAIIQKELMLRMSNKLSKLGGLTDEQIKEFSFNAKQNLNSIELDNQTELLASHIDKIKMSVTRGTWPERFKNIITLFKIDNSNLILTLKESEADLEKLRELRNNTAHSIGRNIEASQLWFDFDILKIKKVELKDHIVYQHMIKSIVKELDLYIMKNHIGCFQELFFFHCHYSEFNDCVSVKQKANLLREMFSDIVKFSYSSRFCVDLVEYYEKNKK